MTQASPLLEVEDLTTRFYTSRGEVGAVEKLSFRVNEGEAVGIVGESGSGKSVTALSLLRLVPMPGRIAGGRIKLRGVDLLPLSCLLYTSPSPRDRQKSRMPSSA